MNLKIKFQDDNNKHYGLSFDIKIDNTFGWALGEEDEMRTSLFKNIQKWKCCIQLATDHKELHQ